MISFAARNEDVANNPSAFLQHLLCSLISFSLLVSLSMFILFSNVCATLFFLFFFFFPSYFILFGRAWILVFPSFFTSRNVNFSLLMLCWNLLIFSLKGSFSTEYKNYLLIFILLVLFAESFNKNGVKLKSDTFEVEMCSSPVGNDFLPAQRQWGKGSAQLVWFEGPQLSQFTLFAWFFPYG